MRRRYSLCTTSLTFTVPFGSRLRASTAPILKPNSCTAMPLPMPWALLAKKCRGVVCVNTPCRTSVARIPATISSAASSRNRPVLSSSPSKRLSCSAKIFMRSSQVKRRIAAQRGQHRVLRVHVQRGPEREMQPEQMVEARRLLDLGARQPVEQAVVDHDLRLGQHGAHESRQPALELGQPLGQQRAQLGEPLAQDSKLAKQAFGARLELVKRGLAAICARQHQVLPYLEIADQAAARRHDRERRGLPKLANELRLERRPGDDRPIAPPGVEREIQAARATLVVEHERRHAAHTRNFIASSRQGYGQSGPGFIMEAGGGLRGSYIEFRGSATVAGSSPSVSFGYRASSPFASSEVSRER